MSLAIPTRYAVGLESLDTTSDAAAAIRKFLEGISPARSISLLDNHGAERYRYQETTVPEKGLILCGPVGTGKSTLLGAAACKAQALSASVAWVRWTQLCRLASDHSAASREDIDYACRAQVLCLDELGQIEPLPYVVGYVLDVIEARYVDRRPILAATNATWAEIEKSCGAAMASRLREMCLVVPTGGKDRRPIAAAIRLREKELP